MAISFVQDSVETVIFNREEDPRDEHANRRCTSQNRHREPPKVSTAISTCVEPTPPNTNDRDDVVIEVDSTTATDTESDVVDSSEAEYDPEEYETFGNNWEIELLAAQIRERRSASLDPTLGRPIRKRFIRGSSMEHRRQD